MLTEIRIPSDKEREFECIDYLTKAHNIFITLPTQHPSDLPEWIIKMHDLQRILMAREAVRQDPEKYYHESK